ncbi:MAG TPA: ComEC/Rec2 family competence protein [Pyrinomonadaceae bacterium]
MARTKGGCGCAVAVLAVILGAVGFVGYKFGLPWLKRRDTPPPSGKELQLHVLDVGQGDSILIISPEGKVALIDAGDAKGGKAVVDALNRYGVKQVDYFIATHSHPDHIGGAPAVFGAVKVVTVLHNDFPPPGVEEQSSQPADPKKQPGKNQQAAAGKGRGARPAGKSVELPTVKAYNDFKGGAEQAGAEFKRAEPDQKYDLGGGVILTVLGPTQPLFTREQLISSRGGNEQNANSIILRLDYGDFSMLLPGDAEEVSEGRLVAKDVNLGAAVLKVAHHGSKYATSEEFLKRVQPKAAIISAGEFNRYGHPSQGVMERLKAAGVGNIYRTDLQGEITITTTGQLKDGKLYEIRAGKETKADLWAGREAQKDDSSRSGFISYGDFGPPPRPPKEKAAKGR